MGDRCHAPGVVESLKAPVEDLLSADVALVGGGVRLAVCLARVGRKLMVVTKIVQDSPIDSKWQSNPTGRPQARRTGLGGKSELAYTARPGGAVGVSHMPGSRQHHPPRGVPTLTV
ncbi:hypothetical protein [Rhodococcus wratislaviensis]|uniref:hypothetical protein n=1 Tax=Rhodococcus wratislaviensis TaxID=44752 RepID=UPI0036505456